MLTQGPARIVQLIWEYKSSDCQSAQFVLIEISKIVEVINSSINFFIYCGLRPKFRNAINTDVCSGKTDLDEDDYTLMMAKRSSQVNAMHIENGNDTKKILMETHDL